MNQYEPARSSDRPLPPASGLPHSRSRELPPYRGLVAVDAKDFTGHPAIEHGVISRAVPDLLERSFARADLAHVWNDRRFPASTGDGFVFGFDPAWMPYVIHPWLHTLQDVLTEFNVHSAGTVRMRLRVSLHIGPLPDTGDEFDGNGTPRNDTHRLLDSRPVKAMLAASRESVTHVAAILSDRCYQDAVASGYTGRHPDHFVEVPATVEGKNFDQRAWLYVPMPSGNLYDRRILGDHVVDDHESARHDPQPRQDAGRTHPVATQQADRGNINSGTVHGGQSVTNTGRDSCGGDRIAGDRFGGDRIGGNRVDGDYTAGDRLDIAGDYVGGNKAGTVNGSQGDTVRGNKREKRR
ncbi:hypothetical protein [Kitasatospora sp. CB01950]|uniref:hypothetical protein n=1 Tax=Kitasatospora sp. CB01950 TaxID=1703930 RepID=UPI000938C7AE|nr:hypothetical protein [Kitasatospora sp. CB01950]OKJ13752.1 hypothetical protein AMK19_10010 [Kitasatospora sp. CB01950]